MTRFPPEKLKKWTFGRWDGSPPNQVVGFCFDTRRLRPGEMFVCLKTDRRDGHDFLPAAKEAGATGAIVAKYRAEVSLPQLVVADPLAALQAIGREHRREFVGPVIGIAGSCGKTSTKDLLAILLGGRPEVLATDGNLNNLIGVPVALAGLDPDQHRAAVIEAGINTPGEMEQLTDMIRPDHAIITLVSEEHLENLGDLATVAREESLMGAAVPPGGMVAFPASCLAYPQFHDFNADSIVAAPEEHEFAVGAGDVGACGRLPRRALTLRFSAMDTDENTVLRVRMPDWSGVENFVIRRVSGGMASNAAMAIGIATRLGVPVEAVRHRLSAWGPARFRGEVVSVAAARFFVDCYNASPAAMRDSITFFQQWASAAPRLYILGCMAELGKRSAACHRELGSSIKLRANDKAFITGADAVKLREGMLDAGNLPDQVIEFKGIEEIDERVRGHSGDIFLKGSRVHGLERLVEACHDGERKEGVERC